MNWNTIDTCIQNKSLLNHPFYVAWSKGALTLDDLRFYAKQYYALETTFPSLLKQTLAACEKSSIDAQLRTEITKTILENLSDEVDGEENHRELWLRFAEGLGLTREEVINAPRHPMTQQCIDELTALASNPDPAVGLSALYAYEKQLPDISQSKIDGLNNFYGIDNPRALQFFEVHKTADAWHSEQEKTAITRLKATMSTVFAAVEKSCDALRTFMDGVDQSTRLTRPCAEMMC